MRSDEKLPRAFAESAHWVTDPVTGKARPEMERLTHYYGPDYHRHSYSGSERNKLFLNRGGREFLDLSALSGADTAADSRSWCALDYDRDGRTDIAVVHANTPLLDLYRNRIGDAGGSPGQAIAVRLVGGNRSSEPSSLSNRDGIGAVVRVTTGNTTQTRVRRAGEGFAAQNSSTMQIGIGGEAAASKVTVTWPSGHLTTSEAVPAGWLVVLSESDGEIARERYVVSPR